MNETEGELVRRLHELIEGSGPIVYFTWSDWDKLRDLTRYRLPHVVFDTFMDRRIRSYTVMMSLTNARELIKVATTEIALKLAIKIEASL